MKTRNGKALLALLLSLVMLFSLCSFTAFAEDDEPLLIATDESAAEEKPFTLATKLTEDDQFIFVIEYEGETYAMDFVNSSFVASPVTIEGDEAIPSVETEIWWAREDDQLENAGSTAEQRFVYAGSSGLMAYLDGRSVVYDNDTKTVLLHNNRYWLAFDGKTFGLAGDAADAVAVTLYGREMPKTEKEEKFIPDGSDIEPEVRDAVRGEDGTIKLAFVSDIHYSTGYPQMNLQVWLENVLDEVGYIDAFGSCGDMGSAYAFVAKLYWIYVGAVFRYMDSVKDSGKIGSTIYTFGNHEWITSMGGDFTNFYENETAKRLLRVGEALRTDDYIFYCLGAGSMAAKQRQGYSDEDIARIEAYLADAPTDIPIFVLTHFPLHCCEDRTTENAEKLIALLNEHPNVVFLWGHNHSESDPMYNRVMHPGDKIVIDGQGTEAEINFTYLSAGCISDAEYTGADGGSAWVQGKGLIVTIEADGSLKYEYYTLDGEPMEENGPYTVTFREGAYYSILERQLVEPGGSATLPEAPEIPNYTFVKWDDTDLDNITGHKVVTAEYEFNYGLDPDYVYMTVQVGDTIALDTAGEPVIEYAIPYDPQMTVMEMIKQVEIECLGTDASEVTSVNSFGAISAYWGTAVPDTAKVLIPTSENYVATQDYVTPGVSYYFIVRESDDNLINPTYLTPFDGEAWPGEEVEFFAGSWGFNPGNMMYPRFNVDGDVLCGDSLETLADTGVKAVDGKFTLTFDEGGTWYVAVKSEGNALAVNKITVGEDESEVGVRFSDVPADAWYADYVTGLTQLGVINGYPDGTFKPAGTLTWAEAMKLLLCGSGDLENVTGDGWAETAIAKAAELGLCAAEQDGAAEISRLQFCKAAAKLFSVTGTAEAFPDCDDADVLALVDFGVIDGFTDGTFRPDATLTRAQIAKIIWLLVK